jgi:hypothetical protein
LVLDSKRRASIENFTEGTAEKIFGLKRGKVTGAGENCVMESFVTCSVQKAILG